MDWKKGPLGNHRVQRSPWGSCIPGLGVLRYKRLPDPFHENYLRFPLLLLWPWILYIFYRAAPTIRTPSFCLLTVLHRLWLVGLLAYTVAGLLGTVDGDQTQLIPEGLLLVATVPDGRQARRE